MTALDHLVIACSSLQQGIASFQQKLGIDLPVGGRHEMMGTHNCVMSLGNGIYLELIAINHEMQPPDYPRWFALDDPHVRALLAEGPRLLTWAVNTDHLQHLVNHSVVPLGQVREARRDNLRWKVAISEDGRMPAAGYVPLCIEWLVDFHPSEYMQDLGIRFKQLKLYHPRVAWLKQALKSIGADQLVTLVEVEDQTPASMELVLQTNGKEIVISSSGIS